MSCFIRLAVAISSLTLLDSPRDVSATNACDSAIYCNDAILRAFQLSNLFNDSKTFVDLPLKFDPSFVFDMFDRLRPVTEEGLRAFLELFFLQTGSDIVEWRPADWTASPPLFANISDPALRMWASELNKVWLALGRKINPDVYANPQRHSILPVPHPFIVPGGRFREFYYWDTYWIVKGLLACNMSDTVMNTLLNFVDLVNRYGFVPNGGRVYYTKRSQPPLLSLMIWDYYQHTGNLSFVRYVFDALEREHDYWLLNKTVEIKIAEKSYRLAHYEAQSSVPRPESYKKDVMSAVGKSPAAAAALYRDIASAAESGWDFSTRWMAQSGENASEMNTIRTSKIIPVDLNSILSTVEMKLSLMAALIGETDKAHDYKLLSQERAQAIEDVMWNSTLHLWVDYDVELEQHVQAFYLSSVVPIASGVSTNQSRIDASIQKLQSLDVLSYAGGVPTSLIASHQQWDYPNTWPPLQWFTIVALEKAHRSELAFALAQKWIGTNYAAWKQTGHMYEKYNATREGAPGGGGEYNVQTGFGWTNGVVFYLLEHYGDRLRHSVPTVGSSTLPWWPIFLYVLAGVIGFAAFIGIGYKIYVDGKQKYKQRGRDKELLWGNSA
ncbi:trehalase-like [Oscarella lobularis]|uniref:trehalase-like n=1 Tax=Oscarella lobularis TaxID=121494 RepID=UPI0033135487